jgi:acyl-CoA thioesterase-2
MPVSSQAGRPSDPAGEARGPLIEQLFDMRSADGVSWRSTVRVASVSARLFGGQLAAQGMAAAAGTVGPDLMPVSLHTVYLRPGDASVAPDYDVERVRDGRAFATRVIRASQRGRELARMSTQWQRAEAWQEHDDGDESLPPIPPAPARLPYPAHGLLDGELDLRWTESSPGRGLWFRYLGTVRDDPLRNACISLYVGDLWLLDTLLRRHDQSYDSPALRASSLDYAAWLHRLPDLRGWMYLGSTAPISAGGRGFVQAVLRSEAGTRIATINQEVSVRPRSVPDSSR